MAHEESIKGQRIEQSDPVDPEREARRRAALSFVRQYGDPVLKSSATPVDRFDDSLRNQVSRMAAIMGDALGVGLAAPQLGISQRLLVYRVGSDAPTIVLANPSLEWESDESELFEEGCLSIPGLLAPVERSAAVRVTGRDEAGARVTLDAEGLLARVCQHEIDHLDGILFLDRVPQEARAEALGTLRAQMLGLAEPATAPRREAL